MEKKFRSSEKSLKSQNIQIPCAVSKTTTIKNKPIDL